MINFVAGSLSCQLLFNVFTASINYESHKLWNNFYKFYYNNRNNIKCGLKLKVSFKSEIMWVFINISEYLVRLLPDLPDNR